MQDPQSQLCQPPSEWAQGHQLVMSTKRGVSRHHFEIPEHKIEICTLKWPLQAWIVFSAVDFQSQTLVHPKVNILINDDPRVGQTLKSLTRHRCKKNWHIWKCKFVSLESEGTEGEYDPNMCRINKRVLQFSELPLSYTFPFKIFWTILCHNDCTVEQTN